MSKESSKKIMYSFAIIMLGFVLFYSSQPKLSDIERYKQSHNITKLCEIISNTNGDKSLYNIHIAGINALISLKDEVGNKFLHEMVINRNVSNETRIVIIDKTIETDKNYISNLVKKYESDATKYSNFNDVEFLLDEMEFFEESDKAEKDILLSRAKIACRFLNNTDNDKKILDYMDRERIIMRLYEDEEIMSTLHWYHNALKVNLAVEARELSENIAEKEKQREVHRRELRKELEKSYVDMNAVYSKGFDVAIIQSQIKDSKQAYNQIADGTWERELNNRKRKYYLKIKSWLNHKERESALGITEMNVDVGTFLGIYWDELIEEQPIKFNFRLASGWALIYDCAETEKLKLDDVVPVDKVKIASLQFNTKQKVLKEIDIAVDGESRVIKQYLIDKYGSPQKSVSGAKWEVGKIAITYDHIRRIYVRTSKYQNKLENQKW